MELILWRHAGARILREGQDDLDRQLTPKGERHAQRMAKWLNQRLAHSTRILVSPALRAQETAKTLDRKFKTVASIGPGRSVDDLLEAVRWPCAGEPVLVVGHQPTLGMVAARFLAGADQPWTVRKGGVWWLSLRERDGQVLATLQVVEGPDWR